MKNILQNKKAAMEMSVGTIVTIVLLMSALILGLMLTKGIFKSAKGAVDLTDAQLKEEIQGLFSDDSESKITIIPSNEVLEIKQGDIDDIGIGMKNILTGSEASNAKFRYKATPVASDLEDCGISEETLMKWVSREEISDINIPSGETYAGRVRFTIPDSAPLCTFGFKIDTYVNEGDGERAYNSPKIVDVTIKSK